MMYAIGAGDQLVAVDEFSDYPLEALDLPNQLSGFEPSIEAIAAFEPDLVLIGGDFTGLGDQLAELDIDLWDGPAASTIDDTFRQIEELGAATGHEAEAWPPSSSRCSPRSTRSSPRRRRPPSR